MFIHNPHSHTKYYELHVTYIIWNNNDCKYSSVNNQHIICIIHVLQTPNGKFFNNNNTTENQNSKSYVNITLQDPFVFDQNMFIIIKDLHCQHK